MKIDRTMKDFNQEMKAKASQYDFIPCVDEVLVPTPHQFVFEFYALQALREWVRPHIKPFNHRHERWVEDYDQLFNRFTRYFARIMYEYGVSCVYREMRHQNACTHRIDHKLFTSEPGAVEILTNIPFTDKSILKMGMKYFNPINCQWRNGYGSYPWYMIAKGINYYSVLPDVVFIDHAVDLAHNYGSFFDKENGIWSNQYSDTLTNFMGLKDRVSLPYVFQMSDSPEFKSLYQRAYAIVYDTSKTEANATGMEKLVLKESYDYVAVHTTIGFYTNDVNYPIRWNCYNKAHNIKIPYSIHEMLDTFIPFKYGTEELDTCKLIKYQKVDFSYSLVRKAKKNGLVNTIGKDKRTQTA